MKFIQPLVVDLKNDNDLQISPSSSVVSFTFIQIKFCQGDETEQQKRQKGKGNAVLGL